MRSRKTGVKCEYLRFLVYKVYFYFKLIDARQDTNIKNKPIWVTYYDVKVNLGNIHSIYFIDFENKFLISACTKPTGVLTGKLESNKKIYCE